jgi:hypothetical protein
MESHIFAQFIFEDDSRFCIYLARRQRPTERYRVEMQVTPSNMQRLMNAPLQYIG